ncbi:hypothetical protein U9R80_04670 [Pseudomonas sp. JQ170C]|nr:hypothetical protein [Pseudomonas sp. 170C]WRO78892.1 hypothetical protein U9R80_04670 [Pseudomonas sp. 170C]
MPEHLNGIQRRAQREFGQSYWWEPGGTVPSRAPDFEAAAGN